MSDKKYQIFISSTFNDLREVRDGITKSILSMNHFPIGMEMFSAADDEQWATIKRTIDVCDYYIVVIGHRYGSVSDEGTSYTEKEYNYALEARVPILAFIRERNAATRPDERESDFNKSQKLQAFIDKVSQNRMCDFWEDAKDLNTKVVLALIKAFSNHPRIGWVRADQIANPLIAEELAIVTKENRDLRLKVDELSKLAHGKKPKLEIMLLKGGSANLKSPFPLRGLKENLPFPYPKPIDYQSIDKKLRPYVDEKDVQAYNDGLPTREEFDNYNADVAQYFMILESSRLLEIDVFNNGNCVATDIVVEIDIPDGVIVVENDEEVTHFPASPLPKNPIYEAEEAYKKANSSVLDRLSMPYRDLNITPLSRHLADLAAINNQRRISCQIENGKLVVQIRRLLHTRHERIDGFLIVDATHSTAEYRSRIICAEYSEADIVVVKAGINPNDLPETFESTEA